MICVGSPQLLFGSPGVDVPVAATVAAAAAADASTGALSAFSSDWLTLFGRAVDAAAEDEPESLQGRDGRWQPALRQMIPPTIRAPPIRAASRAHPGGPAPAMGMTAHQGRQWPLGSL